MWFGIIYEELKCNIDTSESVMQWLGRDIRERKVMALKLIGLVAAYFARKMPRLQRDWWGPPSKKIFSIF